MRAIRSHNLQPTSLERENTGLRDIIAGFTSRIVSCLLSDAQIIMTPGIGNDVDGHSPYRADRPYLQLYPCLGFSFFKASYLLAFLASQRTTIPLKLASVSLSSKGLDRSSNIKHVESTTAPLPVSISSRLFRSRHSPRPRVCPVQVSR